MKKNKITSIIAIGLISLSLFGCANNSTVTSPSDKERTEMINTGQTVSLEHSLLSDKSKQTQEELTKNIGYLLTSMENSGKKITKLLVACKADLEKISHDITDYTSDKFINSCPTNTTKGIFKDAKENHLIIHRDAQGFYVTPDYSYILNTYGSSLSEEFKDIVSFQNEATNDTIFDAKTQTLNFETIAKRVKTCEENLAKYKSNGDTYLKWLDFEYFYYSTILNPSDDIFFDGKTQTYKDSVLKQYEDVIAADPDSQLSKDIKGYLDIVKKNGNKTSKDSDDYLNKVNEKFLKVSTTPIMGANDSKSSVVQPIEETNNSTQTSNSTVVGTSGQGTVESPKITLVQDTGK